MQKRSPCQESHILPFLQLLPTTSARPGDVLPHRKIHDQRKVQFSMTWSGRKNSDTIVSA
jgi:hypothetical protein